MSSLKTRHSSPVNMHVALLSIRSRFLRALVLGEYVYHHSSDYLPFSIQYSTFTAAFISFSRHNINSDSSSTSQLISLPLSSLPCRRSLAMSTAFDVHEAMNSRARCSKLFRPRPRSPSCEANLSPGSDGPHLPFRPRPWRMERKLRDDGVGLSTLGKSR